LLVALSVALVAGCKPAAAPTNEKHTRAAAQTAAPEPSTAPPSEPAAPPPETSPPAKREEPPKGFRPIPRQRPGGFPGTKFSYVEAFAITQPDPPEVVSTLNDDGTFVEHVVRPGVRLDERQQKRLLALIRNRASYQNGKMAACFEPRHTFVFFDEAAVPVAIYAVCFECHNHGAEPAIPGLPLFIDDLHVDMLTDRALGTLAELCRELGLKYCPDAKAP
jgi:hypothetical protein